MLNIISFDFELKYDTGVLLAGFVRFAQLGFLLPVSLIFMWRHRIRVLLQTAVVICDQQIQGVEG